MFVQTYPLNYCEGGAFVGLFSSGLAGPSAAGDTMVNGIFGEAEFCWGGGFGAGLEGGLIAAATVSSSNCILDNTEGKSFHTLHKPT